MTGLAPALAPSARTTIGSQRQERVRARLTSTLLVLVGLWFLLPRLIQTLQVPKTRQSIQAASTPYTSIALYSEKLFLWASMACSVWIIATQWRSRHRRSYLALAALLLPWAYMVFRDASLGQHTDNTREIFPLVVLALWMLRPRLRQLAPLGHLVGITALISIVIGVVAPAYSIYGDSASLVPTDKQLLPWGTLAGIYNNGNNLGQFLVMGLPAVFFVRRGRWRTVLLVATVFALLWSAARTSLVALAAAAVAVLLVRAARPASRPSLSTVIGLSAFIVVCLLPFLTHSETAFSNRGYIWQQSILAWHSDAIFGLGANWFQIVGASSATLGPTVFHAHNQFIQLLVQGGVCYAVLVGLLIVLTTVRAATLSARGEMFGLAYLVALAGTCALEVSLIFVDNSLLFPVVVIPLSFLLFTPDADRAPAHSAAGVGTRERPLSHTLARSSPEGTGRAP